MTSQAVAQPQTSDPDASDAEMPAAFSLDMRALLALLPDDDALDDWLFRFSSDNEGSGYQFEIDQHGRLLAMASEGRDGAERQLNMQFDLVTWTNTGPGGKVLTGNEIVRMLRTGRRAADAGWIAPEQVAELPPAGQRFGSIPFAPRFVVEIRSRSNDLEAQQAKMEEWIAYGVALGWLIDPFLRQVHVYRPGVAPEVLDDPETVTGDPELPGFVFNVRNRVFDLQ